MFLGARLRKEEKNHNNNNNTHVRVLYILQLAFIPFVFTGNSRFARCRRVKFARRHLNDIGRDLSTSLCFLPSRVIRTRKTRLGSLAAIILSPPDTEIPYFHIARIRPSIKTHDDRLLRLLRYVRTTILENSISMLRKCRQLATLE